jgi:hypothetical protein
MREAGVAPSMDEFERNAINLDRRGFRACRTLSHFTDRLLRARHKLLAHMTSVAEAKFENFQARVA